MSGFIFAGCQEACGGLVVSNGRKLRVYRGIGSPPARMRRFSLDRCSIPTKDIGKGPEGLAPYAGSVSSVIRKFVGGMKAAVGHDRAADVASLREKVCLAALTGLHAQAMKPGEFLMER